MTCHRLVGGMFFILFFSIGGSGGSLCAQTEEMKRFLQEVPLRWEDYTRRTKQLQGSCSFQLSQTYRNVKAKNSYDMKRNEKCRLIAVSAERTIDGKQDYQISKVFGVTPRYAFTLQRKTPASPWTLTQLIDLRQNDLSSEFEAPFKTYEEDEINVLVRLHREFLNGMVQRPEFRVVACRKVPQAGEDLVEVDFDYPHKMESRGNPSLKGTLLLDPQRFWCLRSYKVDRPQGTMRFQVLELEESDRSLPIPKRAVLETESVLEGGVRNKQEWRFEYNLRVPRQLPGDSEFTLSAFGLPEPAGLEWQRPTPWYLWIGLAGIVCLALAVGIYRCRQRTTANRN